MEGTKMVEEADGYSVLVSPPVTLDDFVLRQGVLLRFKKERLQDRITTEGSEPVAVELGKAVLKALEHQFSVEDLKLKNPKALSEALGVALGDTSKK